MLKPRCAKTCLAIMAFATVFYSCMPACRTRKSETEQRYEIKGKVLGVDQKGATLTIAHDAIPGYMEAMAMPFKLKDERAFGFLATGDSVQAILVVRGDRSWLEELVVTRQSADDSTTNSANSIEPKPGDEVPDFSLVNQDGKRISLRKYRGQALVLTFIYTRCPLPDYCPLMTSQFVEIEKAIRKEPGLYPKTQLLSISVDPEFDTPDTLRSYGEQYAASSGLRAFEGWEFASGSADEVKKSAAYFGMQYWQEGDQIIHSLRTAVIAPDGRLAALLPGSEWKPAEILSKLQSMKAGGEALPADVARKDETRKGEAQKGEAQKIEAQKEAPDKDPERRYYGVGVVEEIHKDLARIQINHKDIKDLMPAMSMPFTVQDVSLLDSVAVGDYVEFGLLSKPEGLIVVELKKR
jgi:protein SCO1